MEVKTPEPDTCTFSQTNQVYILSQVKNYLQDRVPRLDNDSE